MTMTHSLAAFTACAAFLTAAPSVAAGIQLDGQLPMYPNGKLDSKESSLTPGAIAHGVPLVLLTADAVAAVDAWYGSHAGKSCTRQAANGGIKYACPGGAIMIYAHGGQTQVALIPPMGL